MYKLKTYRRVICHDNIEWCKIGRRCQLKTNMRTLALTLALKNLKNLHFIELLLNKVYNIWAKKKFKGVMFDGTESWCNIWRKTDFWLQKWHEEFSKFSFTRACPEVLKLGLWWCPFIQSRKCMRLKFTGEFCVMTMKNDAKFEEVLTCRFKIDMRNLTKFDRSTWKCQKLAL